MRLFSALILAFMSGSSLSVCAQFHPGDVGFDTGSTDAFKKNNIKTQIITITIPNNEPMIYATQTYDANGRLLNIQFSEDVFGEEAEGIVIYRYAYYPDGRLKSSTIEGVEAFPAETTYYYDASGKLTADSTTSAYPSVDTYTYDAQGMIKTRLGWEENTDFSVDMDPSERFEPIDHSLFFWNANRQLQKEILYYDGDFYHSISYTYDTEGHLLTLSKYYTEDKQDPDVYMQFMYNEKGLLSSYTSTSEYGTDIYSVQYTTK
ncbi:MAG: hypothetical protein R2850_13960 [Bacteroidia bacterium]